MTEHPHTPPPPRPLSLRPPPSHLPQPSCFKHTGTPLRLLPPPTALGASHCGCQLCFACSFLSCVLTCCLLGPDGFKSMREGFSVSEREARQRESASSKLMDAAGSDIFHFFFWFFFHPERGGLALAAWLSQFYFVALNWPARSQKPNC